MENPRFKYQPKILSSADFKIRYGGSSGGVITQIIKYLFEHNQINSAINFRFCGIDLFVPMLIYSFEDYQCTGSIYHEINIYKFLKENINSVVSPVLITCLPCQVVPIRRLLTKSRIDSVIISLVCSNQLEKEATYYFLQNNNINVGDIVDFRYRGNGWPSGIQVKTIDKEYFFHNNTSKWIDVFHSQIFNLDRCFVCKDTFGLSADFSIADSWLQRYIQNDNIGSSIVMSHTDKAEGILQIMIDNNFLNNIETISHQEVILSQLGTLQKKYIFFKYKPFFRLLRKIFRSNIYKKYFFIISKKHRWMLGKTIGLLKRFEGVR